MIRKSINVPHAEPGLEGKPNIFYAKVQAPGSWKQDFV